MLVLLLPAAALLAGVASASPNTSPQDSNSVDAASSDVVEPCAQVASVVAAQAAAGVARVDPTLALECLRSVPLDLEGDKKQLIGVQTLSEFQSTIDLLKDPIEGYPYPGVDILGGLEELSDKLDAGDYDNEYDFQNDLYKLINSAYDEHFNYNPDITQIFSFQRTAGLLSLSKDGTEVPVVYSQLDLGALTYSNLTNYTASPIVKINNQPVEDLLREYSDTAGQAQDRDANYNCIFQNAAYANAGNRWATSSFYQGNETVYEFRNGTIYRDQNVAGTAADFTGIVDGQSFFNKFCTGYAPTPLTAANATNLTITPTEAPVASNVPTPIQTTVRFTAVPQQTYLPAPNFYPTPWIIADDYSVGCYFPEDQQDTTILSVPTFEPPNGQLGFTNIVRSCLATAKSKQKKRLIIDLRGNGGGYVLLAFDMFKQLFPSETPYGGTNFRAWPLFDDVGRILTEEYEDVTWANRTAADFGNGYNSIFNANEGLDAQLNDYDSWAEFYGPVQAHGANFTNILRYNLSDSYQRNNISVSGYSELTNITTSQVFSAEDIVLLQDGTCASTCAVFAEFMKDQAHVKQVVFGGRAQTGPMQGVGGVKGANVYGAVLLSQYTEEAYRVASPADQAAIDAKYAVETETFPYAATRVGKNAQTGDLLARVNMRNNIRRGDESLTPLQFVYEAADCRLFYTAKQIVQQSLVWEATYAARWGNGTCVEGSTGQRSSGFGVDYFPNGGKASGGEGNEGGEEGEPMEQSPSDNGAASVQSGWVVVAVIVGFMTLL